MTSATDFGAHGDAAMMPSILLVEIDHQIELSEH
jgi:hypothetical protein